MNIGDWVGRHPLNRHGKVLPELQGKLHKLESVIAGEAVTKCGKRMERTTDAGRLTPHYGDGIAEADQCELCAGRPEAPAAEAEGSAST